MHGGGTGKAREGLPMSISYKGDVHAIMRFYWQEMHNRMNVPDTVPL